MPESYLLHNIDLVILAGGKGTRIKELLGKYPKPMLKFNNKHFIQYVLNCNSKYNFKRIIILCGFRNKIFFEKLDKRLKNLTKIICLKESKLLGTGGALSNLKKLNVKDFVLVNGDTIFNINLNSLIKNLGKNKVGIVALTKNKDQHSKKLLNLSIKNKLLYFKKKSSMMNGGVYFFKKDIFKYVNNKNCSLENEILPKLIDSKKIQGKFYKDFFIDIGSKYFFKAASSKLKKEFYKSAVFLDRDGVINFDYGYVHKFRNFKLRNGVIKGLQYLIKNNYYIFIITNQAGIGKKIYKEDDFIKLHKSINEKFKKNNIFIDDVQFSPFHIHAKIKKYKKNSSLRKPGNKMIENIKLNWDINLSKSFMLGDKKSDYLAAKKSKLKFYYPEKNFYKQIQSIISNY
jgi:D-glycero-D-manno-heptose 1,7-bisphosphate phosphatase